MYFLKPPEALRDDNRAMQRAGDLSRRVGLSGGVIGEAGLAFNGLIGSFQGIVGKVIFDAQRVFEAAALLEGHAGRVAEGSGAQRAAAEGMVRTIEQMAGGVSTVAEHASQTAAHAQVARDLSVQGADVVAAASREIERIARSVEDSAVVIAALGERSEAISGIVKVIREIADQTNLLALNAAIEAARAGEQGRGFAVVADEVRRLAERTGHSTAEINQIVASIRMVTDSAVANMRKVGESSEQSEIHLADTARSLDDILQASRAVEQMMRGIADTNVQQSATAHDLAERTINISTRIEASTQEIAQAGTLIAELANKADQVQGMVRRFDTGDRRG